MPIKFPCKICKRAVAENHKAVCCDVCNIWVHIKCNKINTQTYNLLKRETAAWSCIDCSKDFFPYSSLTDIELLSTKQGKKIKFLATRQKCRIQENVLTNRLNNTLNDSDLMHASSYYHIDEFNETFDPNVFNGLNVVHFNISSLSYDFDQLHTPLSNLKINFDILGVTESRLRIGKKPINNIDLEGYTIESTPTDATCGGALLYMNKNINYKTRNDLTIYKSRELESVFIEVINKRSNKNTIIGCIYRHPCMEPKDFNDTFLQNLIEKRSFENKNIILMGDFNIHILKYDTNKEDSEEFLEKMYTNFLLPYITSPSSVTPRSQTLIDNFFSNIIEEGLNSGNLTTTISDHFVQFVLFKTEKTNKCNSKDTKYIRDFKNLNKENVESDIKETK